MLKYVPSVLGNPPPVIMSFGYLTLGYSAIWAVLFFLSMGISSHSSNQNFLDCGLLLIFLPFFPLLIESSLYFMVYLCFTFSMLLELSGLLGARSSFPDLG